MTIQSPRMRQCTWLLGILLSALAGSLLLSSPSAAQTWTAIGDGLELATFKSGREAPVGDSTIVILRVDPAYCELRLLSDAEHDIGSLITAEEACHHLDLLACINAGMFHTDYQTHVGYMRTSANLNSVAWNNYMSVTAVRPTQPGLPPFRIHDLDDANRDTILAQYTEVVQNLRLIKKPGQNRWSMQEKRWSEAALGEDAQGRPLLIFCRTPYPMYELNEILLSLPIDLVAAQHLEGGPEAQLYIHTPDTTVRLVGSYETHFWENDKNQTAWPVPNLIGIARRAQSGGAR